MAGTELGKAYVHIIPSAEGIKGKIQGVLDPEAKSAGEDSGKAYSSTFGDMLKANLISGAVTGAFQALVNTAGKAIQSVVSNFAEFEQLTGGVETLFKESAGIVEEYAANAYQTAGLSANQYMETVTGFSASLLQSLGGDTEAAARMADLAITDMADNANKMGSDMASIQNAYQGFAKQNYTMLDNLKIGYGGTKTEMERLLDDAEKIKAAHGEMAEYSIDSYADVVEAIHVVQTEMGITGTTAAEASETVQGSIGAMKAAWENLLTGLGRSDADLDKLVNDFADAAETALDNLMPVVENALQGIGQAIEMIAPYISDMVSYVLTDVLPGVLEVGAGLVAAIAQGITEAAPGLLDSGVEIITAVVDGSMDSLPVLADGAVEVVTSLLNFITENAPILLDSGVELLSNVATSVIEYIPALADSATQLVSQLLTFISDNAPTLLASGVELVLNVVNGIIENLPQLITTAATMVASLVSGIGEHLPEILETGITILGQLIAGLIGAIPNLVAAIPQIITSIVTTFTSYDWGSIGSNIISGIAAGISAGVGVIIDAARSAASAALSAAKSFLGIASPSKVMRDEVGVFITEGIAEGITAPEALYALDEAADVVTQRIAGLFGVDMNGEDSDAIKAVKAWKDAWEDALDDTLRTMEHRIFLMEQNGGEYDEIVATYRKMQEEVHRQAEQARAMGLDENSEYIQKLQKKWWSYENSIRKMDEDREKAALKLLEEQQKELEKLQEEADKAVKDQLKTLSTLADQLTNTYQKAFNEIAKNQEAMQNKLASYGDLFSEKNGYKRLNSLDTQTKMLERYGAVLDKLQTRGINSGLLDEVLGMNVEDAIWYGEKLMQMSSRDFDSYMNAFQEKQDLAAGIAEKYYAEDYEALNTEYLQNVLDQVGDLFAEFLEELPEGGEFRDYIESSVAEGFAETLESLLDPILGGGAADFALENAQQFSDARDVAASTRAAERDDTMVAAFGDMTRDIVNGIGGLMDAHMNQGESELSVEVGGETLARVLLPYLIATAKANGTPIVNV